MRRILLTGASRGIGAAIAAQLLDQGHQVIGLNRHPPDDARIDHVAVDLSDPVASDNRIVTLLRSQPVDALICNAGIGLFGGLETHSPRQIRDALQLNLLSPLLLVRACLPVLRRQPRSDIIFIGSEAALRGARYGSVYSAAKFGLRGAAQALRHECAGSNCHVGIVQPGMVRSGFFDDLDFEPGPGEAHALHTDDVAAAVLAMLHAPDHAVLDEITINPLQRVVAKKPRR